jgi:hypothetical protein
MVHGLLGIELFSKKKLIRNEFIAGSLAGDDRGSDAI